MTWHNDPKRNRAFAQGEVAKIRWEVIQYTQGTGLDLGCGDWKLWSSSIGVGRGGSAVNLAGDVSKRLIIDSDSMDYVFSSHTLEDIEDTDKALAEWWRVLKVGGHLVVYLPHKAFYPNRGQRGANPAHKHDFEPEDIVKAMQRAAPDWAMVENQERSEGDEYSFLQVYQKRAEGKGQGAAFDEIEPAKRCIVVRAGGYGDVYVAASTFPHLQAEGWHLTVYTGAKGVDVLKHDPNIDRLVQFDVTQLQQGQLRQMCDYLRGRCKRFINFSETFEGLLLASPRQTAFWWSHGMRHRYMNGNYLEAAHEAAGVAQVYHQRHYATPEELDEARAWRNDMRQLVVVAATGTGVNKIWPHLTEYALRLVIRNETVHVVILGGVHGAQHIEEQTAAEVPATRRVHQIGDTWPIRRALALAQVADLVIGPETGTLNAVALDPTLKIVLLSHSSAENLTKHWTNTTVLSGDVPCYPCHRLHADWRGCHKDPATELAACQAAIAPMRAIRLTEQLLELDERAAA